MSGGRQKIVCVPISTLGNSCHLFPEYPAGLPLRATLQNANLPNAHISVYDSDLGIRRDNEEQSGPSKLPAAFFVFGYKRMGEGFSCFFRDSNKHVFPTFVSGQTAHISKSK